jgi:uncharacterized membrane protein YgaE (UPF0421/DUF939 family)
MKSKILPILILFIVFTSRIVTAQDSTMAHEISGNVPELEEFHNVIYEIWHNAYPNKDIALLKSYVNDVNSYSQKVFEAKLPGILRDKEPKWNEGLEELKKAVDEYNTAAAGTNDEQMLNAAEALHAKFEMMVRIIRPVLKEVDDFHKVLYVIYHKYMPEKNYDAIKSVCEELKTNAEAIVNAKPNKKVESKLEEFKTAADNLLKATTELCEICKGDDNTAIDKAVENMHTKYQKLEAVFD